MNFTNYQQLVDEVKAYLNREDEDVLKRIPRWISNAEDGLNKTLLHPAAENVLTVTVTSGSTTVPIPTKLLYLKNFRIRDTGKTLYRRSLETLYDLPDDDKYPTGYSRKKNEYVLNKAVNFDYDIEFIYYQAPDKLANPEDFNIYLRQCPAVLLYSAVSDGFAYLMNREESEYYREKAATEFALIKSAVEREEYSGSTLVYFGDQDKLQMYF